MNSIILFGAEYLYLAIVIVALFYLVLEPKKRSSEVIVAMLIALPLTYIAAKIMSTFYYDPRPFIVGNFAPLLPHAPDNGFPSDHTLFGAAIAVVIFSFERRLGVLLLMVALLVGMSRVAAGVHHFTDIMGSVVIATVVTYGVSRWILPEVWRHMPKSVYKFLAK